MWVGVPFSPILWKLIADPLDGDSFSGHLAQLHSDVRHLSSHRRVWKTGGRKTQENEYNGDELLSRLLQFGNNESKLDFASVGGRDVP